MLEALLLAGADLVPSCRHVRTALQRSRGGTAAVRQLDRERPVRDAFGDELNELRGSW